MKTTANEIFGVFERYNAGKCSYDRALEDASKIIDEYTNTRPLRGYITTGKVQQVLSDLYRNKKQNAEKSYLFNVEVHRNQMEDIERFLELPKSV